MTRDMKDALFDHGLVRDVFHCPSRPTFDHYDEIWQEIDKDRYVGDYRQVFNITNYNMLTYQSDYVSNQTKSATPTATARSMTRFSSIPRQTRARCRW